MLALKFPKSHANFPHENNPNQPERTQHHAFVPVIQSKESAETLLSELSPGRKGGRQPVFPNPTDR